MVITTLHGSVTYNFTTLPPPPTILQVTDFDFWSGAPITLTGKGFASVSDIKLKATGDEVTIVSKNDSTLVLTMPTTSAVTESTLLFTYTSGSNTGAQSLNQPLCLMIWIILTMSFSTAISKIHGEITRGRTHQACNRVMRMLMAAPPPSRQAILPADGKLKAGPTGIQVCLMMPATSI